MKEIDGLLRGVVQVLIRGYRVFISPLFGLQCRYFPSCSSYASEAVQVHGLVKGTLKASVRLLRCHPFSRGGWDPVSK